MRDTHASAKATRESPRTIIFAWPERPAVGTYVQLHAGSDRMMIVRFEGDVAICRKATGDLFDFHYRVLRPWVVH